MAAGLTSTIIRDLQTLFSAGSIGGLPDGELLERFIARREEGAFEIILSRLPAKYRIPIVLCHLEGKTHKEAAGQLGWPEGTLSGRLSRARTRLRDRLARRGLALSGGSLVLLLSQKTASASAPTSLVNSTVRTACIFAVGHAVVPGLISPKVATLTQGVLRMMRTSKLATYFALATGLAVAVSLAPASARPEDPGTVAGRAGVAAQPGQDGPVHAPAPRAGQASSTPPVTYKVQWRVSSIEQTETVGPSVSTLTAKPAHIHIGTKATAPNGEVVPLGLIIEATATPTQDGRVCVSIRADRVEREAAEGDGLQVHGMSTQFVKVVKLGETIDLDFKSAPNELMALWHRLSFTIVTQMSQ
jgi:hypothetical protein